MVQQLQMEKMFKEVEVIDVLIIQPYIERNIFDIEATALKMDYILHDNVSVYEGNRPVFITKSIPDKVKQLFDLMDPNDAVLGDETDFIINEYKSMMENVQRIIFVLSHKYSINSFYEIQKLFDYANENLKDKEIECWYIAENIIEDFDEYVKNRLG